MRFAIVIWTTFILLTTYNQVKAQEQKLLSISSVSELPISVAHAKAPKASIIAVTGGKGIRHSKGTSKNFLGRTKNEFIKAGFDFYLFPNKSKHDIATYPTRASKRQSSRINALVSYIKSQNSRPIFLLGFSRGTIDVSLFPQRHPHQVQGLVLISGIYKNNSKKGKNYSLEKLTSYKVATRTLVVHHRKDACKVSKFDRARNFATRLKTTDKKTLFYKGGGKTGRKCGPFHFHGFERIEKRVAAGIIQYLTHQLR